MFSVYVTKLRLTYLCSSYDNFSSLSKIPMLKRTNDWYTLIVLLLQAINLIADFGFVQQYISSDQG